MSYPYRVQCRLDVGRAHLPRVPMRAPPLGCTERNECSGLLCELMQRLPSLARRARCAPHTPHTAHYTRTSPQAWTSSRAARTDMPTMCQPAPLGTLPTHGGVRTHPCQSIVPAMPAVASDHVRPPVLPHSANVRHCSALSCCTSRFPKSVTEPKRRAVTQKSPRKSETRNCLTDRGEGQV